MVLVMGATVTRLRCGRKTSPVRPRRAHNVAIRVIFALVGVALIFAGVQFLRGVQAWARSCPYWVGLGC